MNRSLSSKSSMLFSALTGALLLSGCAAEEGEANEPIVAESIERALAEKTVDLKLDGLGAFPMSAVEPPKPAPSRPTSRTATAVP